MKKLLIIKLVSILLLFGIVFLLVIAIISAMGYSIALEIEKRDLEDLRKNTTVINNQLYAEKYRSLLDKYYFTKGYVSLERLVYFLQRTNNVLDTSNLSYEKWDNAYLTNTNEEYKQMIPIKTICTNLKTQYPFEDYSIQSGRNNNDIFIDKLELCKINDVDITNSDEYTETYSQLPYLFPLRTYDVGKFTSIVNEQRDVNLDLSESELDSVNFHSGWDISANAQTGIHSICDGTVIDISFTQSSNVPFNEQSNPKNKIGNIIRVKCDITDDTVIYAHLYPNSKPFDIALNNKVKKGQLIGRVGTTGQSTGNHLHLELRSKDGVRLDALTFINLKDTTPYIIR